MKILLIVQLTVEKVDCLLWALSSLTNLEDIKLHKTLFEVHIMNSRDREKVIEKTEQGRWVLHDVEASMSADDEEA